MNDYRLIYVSDNRLAQERVPEEVAGILDVSRRNNALVGVTGALMFSAGCFVQVLEGPQQTVEATFERIQRDDRHGNVHVVEFEPVEARSFSNWSMAYVGRPEDASQDLATLGEKGGFDPRSLGGNQLLQRLVNRLLEDA
jgi:hypothetical protein